MTLPSSARWVSAFCWLGLVAGACSDPESAPLTLCGDQPAACQASGGVTASTGGSVSTGGTTSTTGGTSVLTGGVATTSGGSVSTGGTAAATGGTLATGGSPALGGSKATGGTLATGGSGGSAGKSSTGGSVASGGKAGTGGVSGGTGGSAGAGGSTGGQVATGGKSSGGANTGGASTGGANTGGTSTGGTSTGGTSTGGTGTGGASTGGASTGGSGGASTGGSGGAATVVELALGKPATAKGAQTNNPVANGNDGVTSTRFCAADGTTGNWWRVDLGAVHELVRVEIMWEFARQYGYLVEISSDDVTYTVGADLTTTTGTMQTQTVPLSGSARYVRVTATALPASPVTWMSFFEIKVYGT